MKAWKLIEENVGKFSLSQEDIWHIKQMKTYFEKVDLVI